MKFTTTSASIAAVLALFLANSQAVLLKDDCGGKWCNKGLAYDFDEATLRKAEADNVKKTHAFNGATKSYETASSAHSNSAAKAAATAAADAEAGTSRSGAASKFAGTNYKSSEFSDAESKHAGAVKTKEATLDAALEAAD